MPQVRLPGSKAWQRTGCHCRRSRDLSLSILPARLAESLQGHLAPLAGSEELRSVAHNWQAWTVPALHAVQTFMSDAMPCLYQVLSGTTLIRIAC